MAATLRYLGHAGFWIQDESVDLLMDPWFSPSGAFHSGWYQWPPNQHLLEEVIRDVSSSERELLIYVSHEHQDHFCEYSLKKLLSSKKATFLIPAYEHKFFESRILSLANAGHHSCHLLNDGEQFTGPTFQMHCFVDDVGLNHDSAVLYQSDSFSFLNQNDCKIFDRINEIKGYVNHLVYYAAQFSGATWHPSTFEMEEEEKQAISIQRNRRKFELVAGAIEQLACDTYIASAGPVCFLDANEEYINDGEYNFPHGNKFLAYISDKLKVGCAFVAPMPGEFVSEANDRVYLPTTEAISEYRARYFSGRPQLSTNPLAVKEFLSKKLATIEDMLVSCQFEGPIIYTVNDKHIEVAFSTNTVTFVGAENFPDRYLHISAPLWWYGLMVSNERGQNLCLTMAPRVRSEKIQYCSFQTLFLFSNLDDIRINFLQTIDISQERIRVRSDDGTAYEINRYCPHQGGDLINCEVRNGLLTCPRHSISYDLIKGGQSVVPDNLTIRAKKLH